MTRSFNGSSPRRIGGGLAPVTVKGRERYEGFIEALGRRLQKGQSLIQEIPEDVAKHAIPEQSKEAEESNDGN